MHSKEMTIYHLSSKEAKKKYWKITEKFLQFWTCLKMWGASQERHGCLFEQLQELVCSVSRAKVNIFFTSFQAGPSVSCQPSKLDCIYEMCGGNSVQSIVAYETRLVIFPISGNNTFEKSNFADPHFFLAQWGCATLSHSVLMGKIIAKHKTYDFV